MHMADALVSPVVGGAMFVASAGVAAYSIKKIKENEDSSLLPTMGVMGAFVFAAQMINFSIPGTGSSGHLCGGMMLSAVLGPYAAFLTMIGVLLIQCLLFADGGILALGCNIWNMAFYACFVGGLLIWKCMMRKEMTKKRIVVASMLGSVISLQLGAFSVVLETCASSVSELPFKIFVSTMQPIHLAIGLVEGAITAAVLVFVYQVRPQMLWIGEKDTNSCSESKKKVFVVVIIAAAVLAGGVSLLASSNPDGLEWSIAKIVSEDTSKEQETNVSGQKQVETLEEGMDATKIKDVEEGTDAIAIKDIKERIDTHKIAIFPEYDFRNETMQGKLSGTSTSGMVGAAVVVGFFFLLGMLVKSIKKAKVKSRYNN